MASCCIEALISGTCIPSFVAYDNVLGGIVIKDLVIIGGGPAGLTAAIYAARAGLEVEVLEQGMCGGQIITTPEIDNYPGLPGVSGADFSSILHTQAQDMGAAIRYDGVVGTRLAAHPKEIITENGTIAAKSVIFATGARPMKLGCPGEERLSGAGVSYCATCDGAFHRGRDVVVVGGGNTAVEDALALSTTSRKVYLVHRRQGFRAEKKVLDLLRTKKNVEWITDAVVEEILGETAVEKVVVNQLGRKRVLEVSGVFIAIGHRPNNRRFSQELELDESGYIVADESCETALPGVFVAGDTRTKKVRQMVTAAADGAIAALAAGEYVAGLAVQ